VFDGFTVSDGNDIYVNGNSGIETFGNTVIQNCVSFNNEGLGIFNSKGVVTNCYIHSNSWSGIYNYGTVSDCTVENNSIYGEFGEYYGGGIANRKNGNIINCKVIGNQVIAWQPNIKNSSSSFNDAEGGGISNWDNGIVDRCLVMNNTAFSYNVATSGSSQGYVSAYARGGGIFSTVYAVVSNCCVFNNKAVATKSTSSLGAEAIATGGVYGGNNYNLTIANNTGVAGFYYENGSEINFSSGPKTANCITDATNIGQNFVRPTSFIGIATSGAQLTELLKADWHLKAGSQYINAGTLTDLPDWFTGGTDLAGKPRTHNGKISIGAYEYDASYTGINELQLSNMTVFPNPATDQITISGLQSGEMLYIYDVNGQRLLLRKATEETEQFVVSQLPSGIYFVKTSNGQVLKWIKK